MPSLNLLARHSGAITALFAGKQQTSSPKFSNNFSNNSNVGNASRNNKAANEATSALDLDVDVCLFDHHDSGNHVFGPASTGQPSDVGLAFCTSPVKSMPTKRNILKSFA